MALVTGAARGIGASIAEVLARDGAQVVCLDVARAGRGAGRAWRTASAARRCSSTSPPTDAPAALVEHLRERHGGVDVVVHNAGITRDKTLGRMSEDQWDAVLAVNLASQERINDALLADGRAAPRAAGSSSVSSMSGIAGNRGQTNYATSKAGVIGMVEALAPVLRRARRRRSTRSRPGFIETQMTAAMPIGHARGGPAHELARPGRPAGRRGRDRRLVREPGSGGVNGNVVRVCGQSLLGA